ncbi:MAG: hypothetical protein P8R39_03960 [Alphaproteobacteria bacterium]|nr:hypothetical protein [Alphaproteobacteria bacterium]
MNGLLAFAGQLFVPISQMALWVLGLRERAASTGESTEAATGESEPDTADSRTIDPTSTAAEEDQAFLPIGQQDLPPGAFPQVELDFQAYTGSTDWDVSLADPTINSPTKLSSAYARKTARTSARSEDEMDYDLLVHVVVSDNNGLTEPQLEQTAMDSLAFAQNVFEGAVTTDITIDFISANSVQIEWSGTLASGDDRLYYPLRLDVEDRAGFTHAFDVQVPILSDTAIA